MPRKHVQSAKTNNPSRPGVLHVTYNRSTTFLWQASSQGLNDGTMWSTCPEHQQGIKYCVKFSMYFNFTPPLEAVYYRIRLQTKHSLAERSNSQVGVLIYSIPPTWRAHSSVRHAQWHVSASNLPKAHMSAKTRGRESDRPQLPVWRLPVWDKKDGLSGAGGRPKMTRHWSSRCGCWCVVGGRGGRGSSGRRRGAGGGGGSKGWRGRDSRAEKHLTSPEKKPLAQSRACFHSVAEQKERVK